MHQKNAISKINVVVLKKLLIAQNTHLFLQLNVEFDYRQDYFDDLQKLLENFEFQFLIA